MSDVWKRGWCGRCEEPFYSLNGICIIPCPHMDGRKRIEEEGHDMTACGMSDEDSSFEVNKGISPELEVVSRFPVVREITRELIGLNGNKDARSKTRRYRLRKRLKTMLF